MKELIERLPFSFALVAQSFIINLRHIKMCKKDVCEMDNGHVINIGRKYKDAFNNKNKEFKQLCLWKESNIFERKDVLQYGK